MVSPTLWSRGIRHLDVVALSHAHSDHMGGLPAVLRNFKPAELWVGNNPRNAAYSALLDEAAALHIRLRELRANDELQLGSAKINVLAPSETYQPGSEPTNNDSLVLHVAYGATSVLLEGDAESPIERAMMNEPGLRSTLLKVGHHGSVSSTQPDFLARVTPQWAVISCGLHNRYGHPRARSAARAAIVEGAYLLDRYQRLSMLHPGWDGIIRGPVLRAKQFSLEQFRNWCRPKAHREVAFSSRKRHFSTPPKSLREFRNCS